MKSIKRPLAAAGAAALLSVSLTACGGSGGGDAPSDASVEDFCGVSEDLDSSLSDLEEDDYSGFVDVSGEAADKFAEVGTPEDIPEDARQGFEALIDSLGSLDAGAVEDTAKELQEASESGEELDPNRIIIDLYGVPEDDAESVTAFTSYSSETCSG